ncbi:hypothetical protein RCL1_003705 [Eukaryota sp. TZLM3-RCL]
MSHARLDPKTAALLNRISSERRAIPKSGHRPPSAVTKHSSQTSVSDNSRRPRSVGTRSSPDPSLPIPGLPFSYQGPTLTMGVSGRPVGITTTIPSVDPSSRPVTASKDFLPKPKPTQSDGILFAESSRFPNIPIVYRTSMGQSLSPDRLNLDRRRLEVVPIIEGESGLRLLNLQHNFITRITNLSFLRNLIFLDLYNNKLNVISGLNEVPNLRVLMIGRNKIEKITGLDVVPKLDVLDLHSNLIEEISGLSELVHLRVLNLAGNRIKIVDGLSTCLSLTELNLRRNSITTIVSLPSSCALLRLFLSANRLSSFPDLTPIFKQNLLQELALDANPVAGMPNYKHLLLQFLPKLQSIDMSSVDDLEVLNYRSDINSNQSESQENSEDELDSVSSKSQSNLIDAEVSDDAIAHNDHVMVHNDDKSRPPSSIPPSPDISLSDPSLGFVIDQGTLVIHDLNSIIKLEQLLSRKKVLDSIKLVKLKYVDIRDSLLSEFLSRHKSIQSINFDSCGLDRLSVLSSLAFLSSFKAVSITGNDQLASSSLLCGFLANNFPEIKSINGQEISDLEKKRAQSFFKSNTSRANSFDDGLKKVERYRHQIDSIVNSLVKSSILTYQKIQQLDSVFNAEIEEEVMRIQFDLKSPEVRMPSLLEKVVSLYDQPVKTFVSSLGKR